MELADAVSACIFLLFGFVLCALIFQPVEDAFFSLCELLELEEYVQYR